MDVRCIAGFGGTGGVDPKRFVGEIDRSILEELRPLIGGGRGGRGLRDCWLSMIELGLRGGNGGSLPVPVPSSERGPF